MNKPLLYLLLCLLSYDHFQRIRKEVTVQLDLVSSDFFLQRPAVGPLQKSIPKPDHMRSENPGECTPLKI